MIEFAAKMSLSSLLTLFCACIFVSAFVIWELKAAAESTKPPTFAAKKNQECSAFILSLNLLTRKINDASNEWRDYLLDRLPRDEDDILFYSSLCLRSHWLLIII